MRKPDFFIVGAPKCGTTALYRFLSQHPEIFLPKVKEVHFFGSDLYLPGYVPDTEKYLRLFANARDETRVGEASVWYLYSKVSAAEIKHFAPEASILIMLRNPVDMIHSLHSQLQYVGVERIKGFESAVENPRRSVRLWNDPRVINGVTYRDVGKYSHQVLRYLNAFGPDNVKIIIFDDFENSPLLAFQETCKFLGVNPHFEPAISVVNQNKQVRSKIVQSIVAHPPTVASKLLRRLTTTSEREEIIKWMRRLNTRYLPRVPIRHDLRNRLQEDFKPDVERLSKLLNRDLTQWCGPPTLNI